MTFTNHFKMRIGTVTQPTFRLRDVVNIWACLVFLTACALVLYVGQFQTTNAYNGIEPIRELWEFSYWLMIGVTLVVMALLYPMRVRSPSDIFLCLYLLGAALWSVSYWPATGLIDWMQAMLLECMLLLPALLVVAGRFFAWQAPVALPPLIRFPRFYLEPVLIALLVLTCVLSYSVAGADASFDFKTVFLRRLSGRENFAGNPLSAYLMQMSVNGIAPFLAYLGMQRRSLWPLTIAFVFSFFSFWLLALKQPTLNVALLATLGYLVQRGRVVNFSRWLALALAAVLLVSVLELWAFDFSLIADYGVRRVILVNSTIQVYFCDLLSRLDTWPLLFRGVDFYGYSSPEYLVGDVYMNNEMTNANTNAYLHQAALGGLVGYSLVALGTAALTTFLDIIYIRLRKTDAFAISTMLGALLIEQAFATTLVSSGVLMCLLLSLVYSRETHPSVDG